MNKLQELIEKKNKLKQLQEEVKEIEQELLSQGIEEEKVDNFIVKKITRLSYKLKKDVDKQEIVEKYPEATDIKVDVKVLTKLGLSQYIEENETEYLQVKKIKDDKDN